MYYNTKRSNTNSFQQCRFTGNRFHRGFFGFFTEIAHQVNKGDNVGMLHLDFCKAHCFDLVGRMI